MIDNETKTRILNAANIVDVVSDFVTLRKAGSNFKGLCPFHNERTPSFSVSPSRNYCHCFSCGEGGNPVSFIMKHEQMTYPEALRWLANKYHIEIREKEFTDEERQQQSERESLFIVNEWASKYYNEILHNDPDGMALGMQYFRSRGFRDDIIEKFRLGFAPSNAHTMPHEAIRKGYNPKYLLASGLCYDRKKDDASAPDITQIDNKEAAARLSDKYHGRVIFPWFSMSGKVVAFGGRVLDSRTKGVNQKYVNSPASVIYQKDHELYGIFQARKQISKEDRVFMVEGYTDVISMHQSGIENVVANSGTALSIYQIRLLHRLTENIVFLYDGDAAGIKAAVRGTDMVLAEGMNIKVLILPDGDDPDSFARKHTAEEFKAYVEEHQTDFIEFLTNSKMKEATDPVKRSQAISEIVKTISGIPDPIKRAAYIQDCSIRLKINEKALTTQMNKFIKEEHDRQEKQQRGLEPEDNVPVQTPETPVTKKPENHKSTNVEDSLIKEIIRHGEEIFMDEVETYDGSIVSLTLAQYIDYDLAQDELDLGNEIYNRILREAVENSHKPEFYCAPHFSQHPDFEVSETASKFIIDKHVLSKSNEFKQSEEDFHNHINHLLLELRMEYINRKMMEVRKKLEENMNDETLSAQLMTEYSQLLSMRNPLAKKLGRTIR